MEKVEPKSKTCLRGHVRTVENTRWVEVGGRLYANCMECRPFWAKRKPLTETQKTRARERDRIRRERNRLSKPIRRPKFLVNPTTGCWEWLGRPDKSGYGTIGVGGRDDRQYIQAHRWFYIFFKTEEFDPMKEIDHLCRNRLCVNPDHLEAVTPEENQRRMLQGPHWQRHLAKLRAKREKP